MFKELKEKFHFLKWAYANRNAKANVIQLKTEQLQFSEVNIRFCLSKVDAERCPKEFVERRMAELTGKEIVKRFPLYYVDEDNGVVLACLDLLVAKRPIDRGVVR